MSILGDLLEAGLPGNFAASRVDDRQVVITAPNGYGLSVINDGYGSRAGLLEFGVLDKSGGITYSTPLTSDVEGWKSPTDVVEAAVRLAGMTDNDIKATQALRGLIEARRELGDAITKVDALIEALGGAS